MTKETYKPVVGYEDYYEVSDLGNVRSLDRYITNKFGNHVFIRGKQLRPTPSGPGLQYLKVGLFKDGEQKLASVHRLVARAFIGEQPEGKPHVCHEDGNPFNNIVSNLRYDTVSANMMDASRQGRLKTSHKAVTREITLYIQSSKKTLKELAEELGIHPVTISRHRHKRLPV